MSRSKRNLCRRSFLRAIPIGVFGIAVRNNFAAEKAEDMSFGVITDLHFAEKSPGGTRFYADSHAKMEKAADLFREGNVRFVVQLGDLIDKGEKTLELAWLDRITGLLNRMPHPWYPVLGNHDLATLSKNEFLSACGRQPGASGHYSFQEQGRFFVVLDANFTSDETAYERGNFTWTDSWIPVAQQQWLQELLRKHSDLEAVIFVHQNLDCEDDPHGVKNAPAIRKILEQSGNVRVVFQGHQHAGNRTTIQGIPYITLKAAVEGPYPDSQACAVVTFKNDGTLLLDGFGREDDWEGPAHP
jgi:alkaline phosphatase